MVREKLDYRANLSRLCEMFPGDGMLTVSECAKWLKCDRQKVTALIERDKLPAVNVGSGRKYASWRVSVESLARFSS